jgi:hypothetical protein
MESSPAKHEIGLWLEKKERDDVRTRQLLRTGFRRALAGAFLEEKLTWQMAL